MPRMTRISASHRGSGPLRLPGFVTCFDAALTASLAGAACRHARSEGCCLPEHLNCMCLSSHVRSPSLQLPPAPSQRAAPPWVPPALAPAQRCTPPDAQQHWAGSCSLATRQIRTNLLSRGLQQGLEVAAGVSIDGRRGWRRGRGGCRKHLVRLRRHRLHL